jgi:hypothetical protein
MNEDTNNTQEGTEPHFKTIRPFKIENGDVVAPFGLQVNFA